MKNDNETAPIDIQIETVPLTGILGKIPTCVYCGDPAPDLVCPDCEARNEAKNQSIAQKDEQDALEGRQRAFRVKVGRYAETEFALLPDTAAKQAAKEYNHGGRAGLTISGPGDTGKTRSAVWLAQIEEANGAWVEFRQCGDLRQEVVQHARNGEYGRGVRPLMRCDVLILDDFGNHEFTRTAEEFFLAMLERRTNGGKRTFVTTQYTSAELRVLFSTPQMADAILRRIGQRYATMVSTKTNTIANFNPTTR